MQQFYQNKDTVSIINIDVLTVLITITLLNHVTQRDVLGQATHKH
jgi:hypothetical protein